MFSSTTTTGKTYYTGRAECITYLKGQCHHEIFASGFFHESSSPKPLKILLGSFLIFRKFAEIFASQGAPVSTTPVVHLELRNSNGPNGIIRGLVENDPCRKPEVENLVTLSL
jgi:hypothetical protein